MNESQILAAIRKDLGRERDLVLWRLSYSGTVKRGDHTVRGGLSVNGAADLVGILTRWLPLTVFPDGGVIRGRHGQFFALEVKAAKGKQSPAQVLWGNLVRERGGFYAVVRSVEDARAALKRARAGESE